MNLMYFIFFNLVIYLPFHLFEEAVGDFPKWMYEHKWLPYHMTHGHWMANNLFIYYPMLLISVFLFVFINQFVCFGVAILIWGIINFGDHFFYTIKDIVNELYLCVLHPNLIEYTADTKSQNANTKCVYYRKISPGLITGTLFLVNSIFGLRNYYFSDFFSVYQLIIGILIGGVLFGLPMGLCVVLYKFFDKYFK